MLNVVEFWDHLDSINPYSSIQKLCDKAGLNSHTIYQQRQRFYMPKPDTLLLLARALGVSIECLLTGEDIPVYSKEIDEIAKWLKLFGNEEDFRLIRRVIGMPGKNNTVSYEKLG